LCGEIRSRHSDESIFGVVAERHGLPGDGARGLVAIGLNTCQRSRRYNESLFIGAY
jgi:hypothetical protein